MSAKRALITGITGQDGSYLAELLLEKGYEVFGMTRRASTENVERIGHLVDKLTLLQGDLLDPPSLDAALREAQPAEVYNLAAQSFVPTSWNQPVLTAEFTAVGVTRVPEDLRLSPDEAVAEAQRYLDEGHPFQAHEVLEASWKAAPDDERDPEASRLSRSGLRALADDAADEP